MLRRRGVELKRIVFALASRDDLEAERLGEADKLHRRRRFIAGRPGIDDARLARLFLQEAANRDVGLDIQHHDMLAVLHRLEGDQRADIGVARRVDDDVDPAGPAKRPIVFGERELPAFDRPIDIRGGRGRCDVFGVVSGHQRRLPRGVAANLRNRAQPNSWH